MSNAVLKPVYDEKVNKILLELSSGISREELAEKMGYSTYKSIDMYMRRKNFKWDSYKKNYIPNEPIRKENSENTSFTAPSKVFTVISLFEKNAPNPDPKAIARLAGFKDHIEMAGYMKGKNFIWDSTKQNYIQKTGTIEMPGNNSSAGAEEASAFEDDLQDTSELKNFAIYKDVLELLIRNKKRLLELLLGCTDASIPRYIVPGVLTTKSIHMSSSLDRLVKEFSQEKNISQRDIFEVALINFFRQYGYEREVNALLNGQ